MYTGHGGFWQVSGRFPEVSENSIIDGPHGILIFNRENPENFKSPNGLRRGLSHHFPFKVFTTFSVQRLSKKQNPEYTLSIFRDDS